jgi:hypothetical protein
MNWKTYLKISFVSLALIGCEDKEAIAKIESAKAEVAKAEAAKAEATAKIESAKAEVAKAEATKAEATAKIETAKIETGRIETAKAEKAKAEKAKADAVDNQRRDLVESVMSFLENESFDLKLEWQKNDDSTSLYWQNRERYQIKDFSYDEDKKILSCRKITEWMHNTRGGITKNSFFSHVIEYKIDLCSATPLVKINDYKDESVQLPAKIVSLNAMISWREVSVDEYGINESLIDTKTFDGFTKREVSFTIAPDVAPRLKTALEDLLKAHNVKVTKY